MDVKKYGGLDEFQNNQHAADGSVLVCGTTGLQADCGSETVVQPRRL